MDVSSELCKLITNSQEIENALNDINCHVAQVHRECFKMCIDSTVITDDVDNYKIKIDSVVDYLHDELNTGHWSKISINLRRGFSAASVIKTLIILSTSKTESPNVLSEALKSIDMGLLMGAPLVENTNLLNQCATTLSRKISEYMRSTNKEHFGQKRKHSIEVDCYKILCGKEIDALVCPSLEQFNNLYFVQQQPVKLQGCISHWPAMKKWNDVNYLLNVAGERTVPIEVGSHYADKNWSQKLMLLKDFIVQYFLEESNIKGYLAQHNLFDQIAELRDDISIPEYCCLSNNYENSSDVDINAWFGPKGTVSPLHYDPKDNLLAQVFGTKQVLLFSPTDSPNLYPHDDKLLSNTAQVDPIKPDFEKFPMFEKTVMYKCLLGPGDMLFIPKKWWHHVTSLEKSFSVSFWWQ